MSSSVVQSWIKIPNVDTTCVQGSAKLVVDQYNKEHPDHILIYIKISEGWYLELEGDKIKNRLYIVVKDSEGHEFIYEAILIEDGKLKKIISFHPGYIDSEGKFWIKIPSAEAPCVDAVAKFAVELNNKEKGDALDYVCVIEGWYLEIDYVTLFITLIVQVKDCLGRVRKYKAVVIEKKVEGKGVWTLKSYEKI